MYIRKKGRELQTHKEMKQFTIQSLDQVLNCECAPASREVQMSELQIHNKHACTECKNFENVTSSSLERIHVGN